MALAFTFATVSSIALSLGIAIFGGGSVFSRLGPLEQQEKLKLFKGGQVADDEWNTIFQAREAGVPISATDIGPIADNAPTSSSVEHGLPFWIAHNPHSSPSP